MANQAPQFTPTGGEGSTFGNYTYTGGQWNQNPQQAPNPIITTGTTSANQFNQDSTALNQMLAQLNTGTNQNQQDNQTTTEMLDTYSDPYTKALDKLAANSDKATQNLIATIKAKKASREQNINMEYDRLKSGLMSLGLSTERMTFTPDLVYGGIMQAENQKASQLADLDQQEATALLEAQTARDEKNFALLKDRIAYLKDIKQQKLDMLKNTAETLGYEQKIGELQATAIYDNLQKLPEDQKLTFLTAVAKKFGIPLMTLQSQVNEITRGRAKKGGTGGGYTSLELRKLRQARIDPSNTEEADNFLYGEDAKSENLGSILEQLNTAYKNPNLVRDGYFTYEYIKNALDNLPVGVTREEFLKKVKDKISLKGSYRRNAKNYGITKDEYDTLTE